MEKGGGQRMLLLHRGSASWEGGTVTIHSQGYVHLFTSTLAPSELPHQPLSGLPRPDQFQHTQLIPGLTPSHPKQLPETQSEQLPKLKDVAALQDHMVSHDDHT